MKTNTMGRVTTEATIESMRDLYGVELGVLLPEEVRRITVPNALVDTGATLLSLPPSIRRSHNKTGTGSRDASRPGGQAPSRS